MKTRKRPENGIWSDKKQLKNVALLLYENYDVTKEELTECKRIIDNIRRNKQEKFPLSNDSAAAQNPVS